MVFEDDKNDISYAIEEAGRIVISSQQLFSVAGAYQT